MLLNAMSTMESHDYEDIAKYAELASPLPQRPDTANYENIEYAESAPLPDTDELCVLRNPAYTTVQGQRLPAVDEEIPTTISIQGERSAQIQLEYDDED